MVLPAEPNHFDLKFPLRPGQTVLLLGTGGVSIAGLQFAKAAGATAIITSSSDEKLAFVKEKFGADHVINYRKTPNWAEEVIRITSGRGVDHVLETGGPGTIEQSIRSCKVGGVVDLIGFLASAEKQSLPDVAMLTLFHQAILRGVQVGSTQLMRDLVRFVTNQKIQPHVDKSFSFYAREQVHEAFEYLQSSKQVGKIGIEF
ncbi:Zinc-type alcohol dehydrogenase protein, partial [Globisporangium splendens]